MRDRLRHALLSAAALTGIAVFTAFALYEKPGPGLGHFFYVAIILAALATGPAIGAGAAVIATAMFAVGVIVNPQIPPSEVLTTSTGIRLICRPCWLPMALQLPSVGPRTLRTARTRCRSTGPPTSDCTRDASSTVRRRWSR